jgi:hypothetical protein
MVSSSTLGKKWSLPLLQWGASSTRFDPISWRAPPLQQRSGIGIGSNLCNRIFKCRSKIFPMFACSHSPLRRDKSLSLKRLLSTSAPEPKEHRNLSDGNEIPFLDVPVLIVGAGPVGTYLSILLSGFGIESAIVERASRGGDAAEDPQAHPRAHVLNARTMELMRSIGLESSILSEMPPQEQWRHFR